jgi:acetyltransferase-like isoleucine patch superfamily enzyme
VVESKSKSVADKGADPEKALSVISARHEKWARELEKKTESSLSLLILGAYRFHFLRRLSLTLARRVEGGEMHSTTLRRLLRNFHGVTIGPYSYGACLVPGLLPPGTSVGNYCSVAEGLRVFRRNHPVGHLSQHPFFYNKELGLLNEDAIQQIQDNPLRIDHDVWIGAGVTILPGCKIIGNGAVIGAGAVVTKDILPFTINVGNPARCIGDRFSPEIRAQIEQTRWWMLSLSELGAAGNLLFAPVTNAGLETFLGHLESDDAAAH